MLDLLKKSVLAALGTVLLTKDMIEEVTKRMVEQGKITVEEAEKLRKELLEEGEKRYDDFHTKVKESVQRGFDSVDFVIKKQHEALEERVLNLEKRILLLESRLSAQEEDKEEEPEAAE